MGMLNWGAAFSKAGDALASVGLEGVKATLEQDKIRLADELAGARESKGRAETFEYSQKGAEAQVGRDISKEERGIANIPRTIGATADATTEALVRNAPAVREVRVADARAVNEESIRAEIEKFKQMEPLKRQEVIDTAVAQAKALSTPEMLDAARKLAQAKHIVDPSFTMVPNSDGTVDAVDMRNPKNSVKLTGADGKPIIRRDSAETTAAVALVNNANTELRIAEAAYKVGATSIDAAERAQADIRWAQAQKDAREQKAAALAVLSRGAKIPEGEKPSATPAATGGAAKPKNQAEFDALPAGAPYINPADGKTYTKKEKPAAAASAATKPDAATVKLQPGQPDPNDDIQRARRAAKKAADASAAEEARKKRLSRQEADAAVASGFRDLAR